MAISPDTVFQTVFRYDMWDQTLLNVVHWDVETTGSSSDEVLVSKALADSLAADAAVAGTPLADLIDSISSDCEVRDITAQVVWPFRTAFRRVAVGIPGTRGINQFPNVQSCVTKRTNQSGRPFVGAIHIPPAAATDYVDGLITAAFQTTLTTLTSWLYTVYTEPTYGTVFRPVVFHGGNLAPAKTKITGREVQPEARVMVRRTVHRGI